MITAEVYSHLKNHGIDKIEVDKQYQLLNTGSQFSQLKKPATLGDGIIPLSKENTKKYAALFDANKSLIRIKKFVPASGAATRMFKELAEYAKIGVKTSAIKELFESLDKLAFENLIPSNLNNLQKAIYILNELGYQSTPKGLIPFHKYQGFTRTPFKEHWIEGLNYAATNGKVELHFTVSEEHQLAFEKIYKTRINSFFKEYNLGLKIDFSHQHRATDTIIVDTNGEILVDINTGMPIVRPGGHGALIQNLNSIEADLIFVKNIDNVAHENHIETTTRYKKALAGVLLELKNKVFEQLNLIDSETFDLNKLEHVGGEVMIEKPRNYNDWDDTLKVNFWKIAFNRPIRVCGMVKNEGEPGGGPFWVEDKKGVSLQIVESAQIDNSNSEQATILQQATHFNPVDLVCYTTDYKGNKFNLMNFIDESTAFITKKSVNGKDVNVLERPGLWNGAMANWNTIFVEVPIETFNPVKTLNDLLKPSHQA